MKDIKIANTYPAVFRPSNRQGDGGCLPGRGI